jgi:hypothetical protein
LGESEPSAITIATASLVNSSSPDRIAYPNPRGLCDCTQRIRSSPAAASATASPVPSDDASSTTMTSKSTSSARSAAATAATVCPIEPASL